MSEKIKVTCYNVIGTNRIIHNAWVEVDDVFAPYSTVQFIDGVLHGQVGTRWPAPGDKMPYDERRKEFVTLERRAIYVAKPWLREEGYRRWNGEVEERAVDAEFARRIAKHERTVEVEL